MECDDRRQVDVGPESDIHLDVFHAISDDSKVRRPVIVYFFRKPFNIRKHYPVCAYFAARGIVAISAGPMPEHGTTPEVPITAGKSVIRYVRAHADELGIDPKAVIAAGGSGDAHIAASCAVIETFDNPDEDASVSSKPDALVLSSSCLDFTNLPKKVERLGMNRAHSVSPVHHIKPGSPPALVMHGENDETMDVDQVYRYKQGMDHAGNRCELRTYPCGHGLGSYRDFRFNETLEEADRFLVSLGYLTGESRVSSFEFPDNS
jgi:acetyl esterase